MASPRPQTHTPALGNVKLLDRLEELELQGRNLEVR